MRSSLKYSSTLTIIATFVLSACGNSESSTDITGTRTKNAVLAEANPETNVDNVDAVATKQIVTTTAAPSTTVVESVGAASAVTTTTPPADASAAIASASTNVPAPDEVESSGDTPVAPAEETLPITDDSIASDVATNRSAEISVDNDTDDSSNPALYIVLLALILGAGGYAYTRKK